MNLICKRICAWILCFCALLSVFPPVQAAEADEAEKISLKKAVTDASGFSDWGYLYDGELLKGGKSKDQGEKIGKRRGNGNARHIEVATDDQNQIQPDVYHTGKKQIIQWSLGISHSSHNGTSKIIGHRKWNSAKVDFHIENGMLNHIRRGTHNT